jgi:hypothetical protein
MITGPVMHRRSPSSGRGIARRVVLGGTAAAAAAGLAARFGTTPASAQTATPSAASMSAHPVVGVWRMTNDLGGGVVFPSLAMFHADGTYIEDFPDAESFSMGLWQPTGERTVIATIYQVYLINDKLAHGEGRFTADVDETGQTINTNGTFVGIFEDGSIDLAVEGPTPGVRLGILPVVPLAQLVPGGTPVVPADLTAATPTP